MGKIEKGRITVRDLSFSYTWERKSVKNLNLRVREGGEVYVSTPTRTTRAEVEAFLVRQADFVRDAMARMAVREARTPVLSLAEGERVPIWGVSHTVCHRIASRPRVWCENGALILALPDPSDMAARERAFSRFATETVRVALAEMTAAFAPAFIGDAPLPEVTVRHMTGRWGSCFYTKNRICYSTRLIFVPYDAVRLTVCHELAHLKHPDHSPAFYAWLARVLPNHKAYKRVLREAVVPTFVWEK